MVNCDVLILGSGHLAYRVEKLAAARGFSTIHVHENEFRTNENSGSVYERILTTISHIDLTAVKMTYIVDSSDNFNLEVLLAILTIDRDVPVTAALFNEKLAPHLREVHSKLYILNPAKIAAPEFVKAIYAEKNNTSHYHPRSAERRFSSPEDNLLIILMAGFLAMIILATVFFRYTEQLSWLNAVYFVVCTVTTVGYGDIHLGNSSTISKIAGIILILSSIVFIWTIFSLLVDRIIKRRIQLALGRKKYTYRNHVIVCGLGRLGYFIAEELIRKKENVLIVESDENSANIPYFRSLGAHIYIGDARMPRVLQDLSVSKAKALISVVNNDYANLEIGLNARSFQPDLRIIVRYFDDSIGKAIKDRLDVPFTLCMSAIADEKFLETLQGEVNREREKVV